MRINTSDVVSEKFYTQLEINHKSLKMHKKIKDDGVYTGDLGKTGLSIREMFEKEEYPDISKVRNKSFQKLIWLLIYLKEFLKILYPNSKPDVLILRLRDLNPIDVIKQTNVCIDLEMTKRTFYDYINTLQMILDYSAF